MANSLLEIGTILPPLLEQQISPPYRIVARHLDYLQKWREYLLCVWINDLDEDVDRVCIQQSVDELISTILLIDFIGRSYPMAIPSLEEILKIVNKPTAFSLCEVVYNQVSCKLLIMVLHTKCPNRPTKIITIHCKIGHSVMYIPVLGKTIAFADSTAFGNMVQ